MYTPQPALKGLMSFFIIKEQERNTEALEQLRQQNESWRINEQNKMKVCSQKSF